MTIKAITFDFWFTLYDSPTLDYARPLGNVKAAIERHSRTNIEVGQFEVAVEIARSCWSRAWLEERRTIPAAEWLRLILAELAIPLEPEHLADCQLALEQSIFTNPPTPVPDARAILAELSARYRLAVISDTGLTPGRVLRQILARDGLSDYFAQLTFSDEVGQSKPHHDIFLVTLKALGVEPEQAVHVGDLLHSDIIGAHGVGMRAIQYVGLRPAGHIAPENLHEAKVKPDGMIKNFSELKLWLQQWPKQSASR